MCGESVFISYARQDAEAAMRLYSDLQSAGLRPWLDRESLLPGQKWRTAIKSAIEDSRFFIALVSSRSVTRQGFVNKELVEALDVLDTYPESDIYLIPARLDDCQPSHQKLRHLNWVDLFPTWETGVAKILKAISRDALATDILAIGKGPLTIDDVIIKRGWLRRHIKLDVRLRNSGTTVVNVTRADLHVLERLPAAAVYQASASYDLLLEGDHNVIAVAHVLQPNEVDRFTIRVGFTPFNTSCFFRAELILHYNDELHNDELRVISKPFDFESAF